MWIPAAAGSRLKFKLAAVLIGSRAMRDRQAPDLSRFLETQDSLFCPSHLERRLPLTRRRSVLLPLVICELIAQAAMCGIPPSLQALAILRTHIQTGRSGSHKATILPRTESPWRARQAEQEAA